MSELLVRDLAKRYRQRDVLTGISLEVGSGEVVGLLGPNGAGKTTCFYMIVGLIRADGGRIELDDRDLTPLPMHARARLGVGYLPQEASVFRKLTVADNIRAVLETRRDLDRAGRRKWLEELLGELQISHIRDSVGISLSGGKRRRVEIARALAVPLHAAGRALRRRRPDLGHRDPADRVAPCGPRDRRAHHRS